MSSRHGEGSRSAHHLTGLSAAEREDRERREARAERVEREGRPYDTRDFSDRRRTPGHISRD